MVFYRGSFLSAPSFLTGLIFFRINIYGRPRIHRSGVDTLVTQPMVVQPISLYGRRLGDELQLRVEFTGPRPALIHPCNCPRPRNSYRREVGGGGEGESFEVDDIHQRRRFSRRRKQCGKVAFHQAGTELGRENSHASATSWSSHETFLDRGCLVFDQMSARTVFPSSRCVCPPYPSIPFQLDSKDE